MKHALILPTKNEGICLIDTINAHRNSVDHIYVVDDATIDGSIELAKEQFPEITFLSLLPFRSATGVRIGGPGRGRACGVRQAIMDGYDVITVSDAHTCPRIGSLRDLGMQAYTYGGVWESGTSPLHDDEEEQKMNRNRWVKTGSKPKWAGNSYFENAFLDLGQPDNIESWNQLPEHEETQYLYGSIYCARSDVWKQLVDAVGSSISYGYNEQLFSMICLSQGIQIFASRLNVNFHRYKKSTGLSSSDCVSTGRHLNMWITSYLISDADEWKEVKSKLEKDLPKIEKKFDQILIEFPDIEATRIEMLKTRKHTYNEVVSIALPKTAKEAAIRPVHGQNQTKVIRHVPKKKETIKEETTEKQNMVKPFIVSIFGPHRPWLREMYLKNLIKIEGMYSGVLWINSTGEEMQSDERLTIINGPNWSPEADSKSRAKHQAEGWKIALDYLKKQNVSASIMSWEPDIEFDSEDWMKLTEKGDRWVTCPVLSRHKNNHLMLYKNFHYHPVPEGINTFTTSHLGLTMIPSKVWRMWIPKSNCRGMAAVDHALCNDFQLHKKEIEWSVRPKHYETEEKYYQYNGIK